MGEIPPKPHELRSCIVCMQLHNRIPPTCSKACNDKYFNKVEPVLNRVLHQENSTEPRLAYLIIAFIFGATAVFLLLS